jgi:hypothetical protein
MNSQESKFILRAYRADGRYAASDPLFAEALAETQRDPALLAWLESEAALDASVANKLDGIQPPAGLRESILVGARASRPRRHWWQQPLWLAAAAAIALTAALPLLERRFTHPDASSVNAAMLAQFGLDDLEHAHDAHQGHPALLADVQARLGAVALPFSKNFSIDPAELTAKKCRAVTFAGHEVFEICFVRNGVWYHLYITPRRSSDSIVVGAAPSLLADGDYASAAWADARNLYTLVTHAGADALRRVL